MSILSDAQELIRLGYIDKANQLINESKILIGNIIKNNNPRNQEQIKE